MKTLLKFPAYLMFIAFLLPLSLSAQSNYKPGYVVNLKGDTLRGFIDYQEWDANPDAINFKKTLTGQAAKYGVDNAASFGIDKLESFIKYTGPISTNQTDQDKIDYGRDTSFRVGTVFLKILEKGDRVALYSYKDDMKIRFFIGIAPGYEPSELIYRVSKDNTEHTYRKQLGGVALKYNELTDNLTLYISKAEYSGDDIMDIASKINHMTKAEYAKNHYTGAAFTIFAGGGLNINTTSPSTNSNFYAAGARSYTSFLPAVYFGINVFANPATRRLQFLLEVSATQSQLREKYMSQVEPYIPTEATYNTFVLSGSAQVIYNFYNGQNFKIFGGLGLIVSSYSFSNNYIGAQDHNNSVIDLNASAPWLFTKSNDAFLFKAGVQFTKHLEVFGEFQTNVNLSRSPYYELSSTSKQIALIYLLK